MFVRLIFSPPYKTAAGAVKFHPFGFAGCLAVELANASYLDVETLAELFFTLWIEMCAILAIAAFLAASLDRYFLCHNIEF